MARLTAAAPLRVVNGDFADTTGLERGSDGWLGRLPAGWTAAAAPPAPSDADVFVACYYFGNYHPDDARNERQKGKGWSDGELVKQARPPFPGRAQSRVPL